jgi:hypothetical protein
MQGVLGASRAELVQFELAFPFLALGVAVIPFFAYAASQCLYNSFISHLNYPFACEQ